MPDFIYKIRRWSYVIIMISMSLLLSSFKLFSAERIPWNRSLTMELFYSNQDNKIISDSSKRIQVNSKVPGEPDRNSSVKPEKQNIIQNKSGKDYKIIAGSFASHENAVLRARQYFSKGYKAEIIIGTGRNRARVELVSIKSFENISEAKSFLKEFQRDIDPSAWLYSID